MGRAPCCEKVGLKKGRWTAEEDDLLVKYIKTNGEGSWRSLPKKAGLLRCGKSCRLRWINYLREDLKRGNISKEEEDTIVQLRANLGNRWSVIAGHLPGRTDNEIKNYWNSHLSKKIDGSNNKDEEKDENAGGGANKVRKRRGGRPSKKKKAAEHGESSPCKEKEREKQSKSMMDDGAVDGELMVTTDQEHEQSVLKESPLLSVADQERNQCGGALSTSVSSSNVEKEGGKEGNGGEVDQVVSNEGGWLSLDEIEKLVNWEWEDIALSLWDGEGEGVGEPLVWDDGCDQEDSGKFGGFFSNSNDEFDAFRDVDYFDNWLLSDVIV